MAPEFNTKDEIRMREMMSQRYDKKRWYVQPTDAMYAEARQQNTTASSGRTATVTTKPLSLAVGDNVSPLNVRRDVIYLFSHMTTTMTIMNTSILQPFSR